ncbi:hypothetical protein YC2023_050941 [Brassica napus]
MTKRTEEDQRDSRDVKLKRRDEENFFNQSEQRKYQSIKTALNRIGEFTPKNRLTRRKRSP